VRRPVTELTEVRSWTTTSTTTTSTTTTSTTTTSTTTTTVAKQVPSAPVLKGSAAKRAVKLTWTAPANGGSPITGYRVLRATSPDGTYTQIGTAAASATSYSDTVASRTTFSYRLVAVNVVGPGPASNTVTVTAK
jgi:titin